MDSWQVLRDAADRIGVKALAARLNLSSALVYKWCQEPRTDEDPEASGARNPLDRLKAIYEATKDPAIVHWLCMVAEGFYVPNVQVRPGAEDEYLLSVTQRMVNDFASLLSSISKSIEDDGAVSKSEAKQIRQCWEQLKSQGESFVVSCESGLYGDEVMGNS